MKIIKMIIIPVLLLLMCMCSYAGRLGRPVSMMLDDNQNINVLSGWSIFQYNSDGKFKEIINDRTIDVWGDKDDKTGEVDISVRLFVKGKKTGWYVRLKDEYIKEYSKYFRTEPSLDKIVQRVVCPEYITHGPEGNIYVIGMDAFRKNFKLGLLDSEDGHPIAAFDVGGDGEEEIKFPHGIAVDSDGNFYVTNFWDNKVKVYNKEGQFVISFGGFGEEDGKFKAITAIAIDDKNGWVYVTDNYFPTMFRGTEGEPNQMRVQKFTKNGKFLMKFGDKKSKGFKLWPPGIEYEYPLDEPDGIAVDSRGDVYVLASYTSEVKKFTSDGELIKVWGRRGTGEAEFRDPQAIATDNEDNVYVADTENNRIQKFDSDGNFLMEIK